ncbi:MAG: AAA family ATPase [Dysgonamonadaceae bacterium]|jgi:AAA+ ATPase superfamily predicted ATPase|nr:AAA family ATPase [Dysgonamonadaceae bacterium]
MKTIIGRKWEQDLLNQYLESDKSEFVAVYGRRRIGKTFLIREFFDNKFAFYFSGVENSDRQVQLENFNIAINRYSKTYFPPVKNWSRAFEQLRDVLEQSKTKGRKVIFIDELPWLDTPASGFIPAFEYFWNTWASARHDIFLIVCGSATSWIINKLIKNRGGLHNRVTHQIALKPFSLGECEEYAGIKKFELDKKNILDYYMIIGGVPYYWEQLDKSLGLASNIDNLFFRKDGVLRSEFDKIYNSLFKHSENHIRIINFIGKKRMGLTRDEIVLGTGLANGGSLTRLLEELEQCGFIRSYRNYGKMMKEKLYQLVDYFSLFHLNFIQNSKTIDESYWTHMLNTPTINSWRGYAFEQVCLDHVPQIRRKLGISGVLTYTMSWRGKSEGESAQVDLLIERKDRIINLCEIKYADSEYVITKTMDENLRHKRSTFIAGTKIRKTIHTTMLTTYGVKHNAYWNNIQSEVTMADLFL